MFKRSLATILSSFNRLHDQLETHVQTKQFEVATLAEAHKLATAEHATASAILSNVKQLLNRE